MKDNNDKKETKKTKPDPLQKKVNETDTAPDEFIAPNADTDQPINGQVMNDAVLRGEPHTDDRLPDPPSEKDMPKMNNGD